MPEYASLEVGQLFSELGNQLRQNSAVAGIAIIGLVGINLALDQASSNGSGAFALSGFLSLIAQYYVTRAALTRGGMMAEGAKGRFGSFWGMNILTGICILVGCLLLIIPGVYLAARWFIAGPAILAGDRTAGEGMRESWETMRESAWQVVGTLLVLFVVGWGAGFLILFLFPGDAEPTLTVAAISYLCMFTTSVAGWLMAVGAYRLLTGSHRSLEEVFA